MWRCDQCELSFASFQAKANHVRWTHKEKTYTDEGLARVRKNARDTVTKRYGLSTKVTEQRTCACGDQFEVTYSPERKAHVKKTCSRVCAARRNLTPEANARRIESCRKSMLLRLEDTNFKQKMLSNLHRGDAPRSSSKAERALAEALKPLGFKRHQHVTVDGLTFDVDIVSDDGRIWVESDGEWHFRQVHAGHNFEATKLRDLVEEKEALRRGVLLVRVNNQTTSLEEQVNFIMSSVQNWTGSGEVIRFHGTK